MPEFKIVDKKTLNSQVDQLEIKAPHIADRALPGQFVILIIDEKGERIPLTIYDKNSKSGTVTLIFQKVGRTTDRLGALKKGDFLQDLAGPLGEPSHIEKFGRAIAIGGGVGTAEVFPLAKALVDKENEMTCIIGARTKELLILEDELRKLTDKVFITTDDGSKGRKGFVTDVLKELLQKEKFDIVFAVGPIPMMKAVAEATRPYNLKTIVSLNSIMVDGTGMCGSCRVSIGGVTKFTCVDGPDFDAHLVDFDELEHRQNRFLEQEKCKITNYH